ncbi:nucleophile aminohydrolase [Gaertneriomyces semiglobifer]|nr:nucleophile aminohydrolase [Gaertneriomyces semiglobifer]
MEALFGITGKDFVLVAADQTSARSIVVMKNTEDKTKDLNKNTVMLYTGEAGDTVQFGEYVQRNVQLYGFRNGIPLSTQAIASFTRKELAESLRSRNPYHVNLLIAGVSLDDGTPELYWLDYLASCVKMKFAAHGYAAYFCMSTMDRYWKPDMSLEEAIALLKKCIAELKTRFIASLPRFTVKVADKNGIREIEI